jgi:hypothetical protein
LAAILATAAALGFDSGNSKNLYSLKRSRGHDGTTPLFISKLILIHAEMARLEASQFIRRFE